MQNVAMSNSSGLRTFHANAPIETVAKTDGDVPSTPVIVLLPQALTDDSPRWREYVFQRYVDIILREAIYLLGKEEPTLTPDDISRKVDDVTTKIHDQAAQDLDHFLFDEKFSA
jgi:hypothetical protein